MIAQLSENRDMIYDASSREFEEIVEQVLQDVGFSNLTARQSHIGDEKCVCEMAEKPQKQAVVKTR